MLFFLPLTFLLIFLHHLYYRLRLPPGPRPWPIVGNLYDIKPVRFRCFTEWAQSYGPIISVWFGSTLNVVVSNSELAKEVLKEKDQQLADRYRSRSVTKHGQNLVWADYGPHYVKVRKVCTMELFSQKRLEALRPIREDEVTAMVESVFNDCTVDNLRKGILVRTYIGAVALNSTTRLVLGKRFVNSEGVTEKQGREFQAYIAKAAKLVTTLSMAEHIPWLRWMFPLDEQAFAEQGEERNRITRVIMEEHTHGVGGAKQHFLDALLTLQDEYDLTEDTIFGLLWDMIGAGMDTAVTAVEWAMAEVIKNPRVQQKAQEELDGVIGHERVMTELDFSNLPYLQSIAKEALRLHPPVPLMLPHRSNTNVKIGGYDIPKGSTVHVNVWAVARDPQAWKDPLEFRPERFQEEEIDAKGHDFRLLLFGAGRRMCPGAQLGMNLVTSMIGHLLHHFHWAPGDGMSREDIDMGENPGLVTYMKTPLMAVPTPRLPAHLNKRLAATD